VWAWVGVGVGVWAWVGVWDKTEPLEPGAIT